MTEKLYFPAEIDASKDGVACFVRCLDAETGEELKGVVAANSEEGWVDWLESGGSRRREVRAVRFELIEETPPNIIGSFRLPVGHPERLF